MHYGIQSCDATESRINTFIIKKLSRWRCFQLFLVWAFKSWDCAGPFGILGALGLVRNSAPNSVRHDNVGYQVSSTSRSWNQSWRIGDFGKSSLATCSSRGDWLWHEVMLKVTSLFPKMTRGIMAPRSARSHHSNCNVFSLFFPQM